MKKRSDFVRLEIETVDHAQVIVGAYLNTGLVAYDLVNGQRPPPRLWLLQGFWPTDAYDEVMSLAIDELAKYPAEFSLFERAATAEIVGSSPGQKPERVGSFNYRIPKGYISLRELEDSLRTGWENICGDKKEAERRVTKFWAKLASSIEDGLFDYEEDQIIRHDDREVAITSQWLKAIQREAEGVFDTPDSVGRYLADAFAPAKTMRRWLKIKDYVVPPCCGVDLSSEQEPNAAFGGAKRTSKTDWVKKAITALREDLEKQPVMLRDRLIRQWIISNGVPIVGQTTIVETERSLRKRESE